MSISNFPPYCIVSFVERDLQYTLQTTIPIELTSGWGTFQVRVHSLPSEKV